MSDLLDLNSLSPSRFERICKAFLEIDTEKTFKTYTEGADGGIDIRYFANKGTKIVGQCKRYGRTNIRKLFSEIKRELPKVISLKPNEYYLYISCDLTPTDEDKLFEMFKDYMPHGRTKHIVSGKNIEDKLSKSKYRVICEENFDLFSKSKSVFDLGLNADIINDSKTLLEEIKQNSKLFVKTKHFYEAKEKFFKSRNILITGEPGIGKTFLSKMLVSEFLKEHKNAEFHFSSCRNLSSLKKLINNDPSVYELFYLDDFLGRAYFELKDDSLNELKYLLKPILSSGRKYVILNSRRSVLNEANEKMKTLSFALDDSTFKMEYINISELSYKDKGLILYNHIVANKLDKARIDEIKNLRFYKTIIGHKSFSPRLIEFITKFSYYNRKPSSDYKELILNSLFNPKDIYADDLNKNHKEIDRMFLYSLRSFDCLQVEEKLFEEFFNKNFSKLVRNCDETLLINPYEDCLSRLNDYYVKEMTDKKGNYLSIGNPSIYDFIDKTIFNENASLLRERLMNASTHVDQLLYLKHDFFANGSEYVKWYENNLIHYKTLKFPSNIFRMFYYYHSKRIDSFKMDEFIDFINQDKNTFDNKYIGVSGNDFYTKIIHTYDIDEEMKNRITDPRKAYYLISYLGRFFDPNELFEELYKTITYSEETRTHFAEHAYETLCDKYMGENDVSDIIESAFKAYTYDREGILYYARKVLVNRLETYILNNLELDCLNVTNNVVNVRDYVEDYSQFVSFDEALEEYFDDGGYDEEYRFENRRKYIDDTVYIDDLFDKL